MSEDGEGAVEDQSVAAAAAGGSRLKLLYALRNRIATEIETCPTRDLSPLTRRLQDIVNDIEEIEQRERQENPGDRRSGDSSAPWTPDDA